MLALENWQRVEEFGVPLTIKDDSPSTKHTEENIQNMCSQIDKI